MNILFVGNSHTFFNDMPRTFARLWEAQTGETARPIMLCHGGQGFTYHVREYFELRFDLLFGGFDVAVFQQKAHPFAGSEEEFEAGKKLAELSRKGGVKPVFAMTWAEKAHPENQAKMDGFHRRLAEETGACLSPVGPVWQRVLSKDPDFPLYFADGEHASVYGDYLIAVTHCRLLSGQSCLDLPAVGCDFFDPEKQGIREAETITTLDEEKCRIIRLAAEETFAEMGIGERK